MWSYCISHRLDACGGHSLLDGSRWARDEAGASAAHPRGLVRRRQPGGICRGIALPVVPRVVVGRIYVGGVPARGQKLRAVRRVSLNLAQRKTALRLAEKLV